MKIKFDSDHLHHWCPETNDKIEKNDGDHNDTIFYTLVNHLMCANDVEVK